MSRCYYEGVSNRGNQFWGNWVVQSNIEDSIVQFCRKAFKDNYKDMWINPVFFDDKYFRFTECFFSEVGVELYPKITNVKKKLSEMGIIEPKTKVDWEEYSAVVWGIIQEDIEKNVRKGVKPICISVRGVRIPKGDGKSYIEKYSGFKKVTKDYLENS